MIDISIIMLAYNHERFIAQAIESILMQKTDARIELIIGEDCSTDSTRKIIRKYEKKHPEMIKAQYHKKNMGALKNLIDCLGRCQGRYIAMLEGDDYWTDSSKLQKQYEFLESHSDYAAVYHNWEIVNLNGEHLNDGYIDSVKSEYTIEDYLGFRLPGQTATILVRNFISKKFLRKNWWTLFKCFWIPGDRICVPFILREGKIYVLDEKLSAYRFYVEANGSNYSSKYENQEKHLYFFMMMLASEHLIKDLGFKGSFYTAREREFLNARAFLEHTKKAKRLKLKTYIMLVLEPHRIRLFKAWMKFHNEKNSNSY